MTSAQALILAGDHYHDARAAFAGVGSALQAESIQVVCIEDFAAFDSLLAAKQLLVILRDGVEFPNGPAAGPVRWMRHDQEDAVEHFVLAGGGFLALHNAGWDYPWQGGYRRTLGGYYIGHPDSARFHVEVVNGEHPVTAGVMSYEIEDEQHWLHWDYDRVTPLLVSQGQDGRQSVSGWAYEYGRGRVDMLGCSTHLAHDLRHIPDAADQYLDAFSFLVRRLVSYQKDGAPMITELQAGPNTWSGHIRFTPDAADMIAMNLIAFGTGMRGIIHWTWKHKRVGWEVGEWGIVKIREFTVQGGWVYAEAPLANKDEYGVGYSIIPGAGFQGFFPEVIDVLPERACPGIQVGERALRTELFVQPLQATQGHVLAHMPEGHALVVENRVGEGLALYVGTCLTLFCGKHLDSAPEEEYLASFACRAGAGVPWGIGDTPPGVYCFLLESETCDAIIVVNSTKAEQRLVLPISGTYRELKEVFSDIAIEEGIGSISFALQACSSAIVRLAR